MQKAEIDPASIAYRGEDSLKDFSRGRNNQPCVFIDAVGKCYTLPAHSLPSARGLGELLPEESHRDQELNLWE